MVLQLNKHENTHGGVFLLVIIWVTILQVCFSCFSNSKIGTNWRNLSLYEYNIFSHINVKAKWSRLEVFCKKGALKNFAKFTGKYLRWSVFFKKAAGLSENFKNTFFIGHLRWLLLKANIKFGTHHTKNFMMILVYTIHVTSFMWLTKKNLVPGFASSENLNQRRINSRLRQNYPDE